MLKYFRSPKFWSAEDSKIARYLSPLSKLFSICADIKINSIAPEKAAVPVICVGNIVLGGAGKTPTTQLVCNLLKERSFNPHIISSGYGGYLKNVVRVDLALHSYLQVGDEALLLADCAPTWIGRNRINSAKAAVSSGADVLVMDDGLQNNALMKNISMLVVDSYQGFGNCRIFPAGPLRESVESGVLRSDVVLIVGHKNESIEERIRLVNPDIPICYSHMKIIEAPEVENRKVLGFCGLGFPDKFKKTLTECGYDIVDFVVFGDHHSYTITEIQKLITAACNANAKLVTTMKDYVKIPVVFKKDIAVVKVQLELDDEDLKKTLFKS
ncbi:MAG: tetraacyldisaccharide 4'-kinase [Holosporales bacterium]|nr:tetraacyldisaccharide 4'-kinase [Holosporales bacterium]